jgi:nucleotide-binding universal stress UspA family protein
MPWLHTGNDVSLARAMHDQARLIVDEAIADARAIAPGITVSGEAIAGHPAQLLVDGSHHTGMVVVGSRGLGGFGRLLLGSVGAQVAMHAYAPVAVVRGRADTAAGPVVVGVDGSPTSETALGYGFEEAAGRGCGLIAVTAYPMHLPLAPIDVAPLPYDRDGVVADLTGSLGQAVAGWQDKYPKVPVESQVVQGGAAEVLTDLSRQAQLVVVGTRGHGGIAGLLLGSVGQQLLHHADCPVLIARTRHPH